MTRKSNFCLVSRLLLTMALDSNSGWVIQAAAAINDAGQIAATGTLNGSIHAVLLTPIQIPAAMSMSETSLKFGLQSIGTKSPSQTLKLISSGKGALKIKSIVATGDFTQSNTCASTMPPGKTCSITVTFSPKASKTRTGSITVSSNSTPKSQILKLTGTGTAVGVSTKRLDFGTQKLATTGAPLSLTLTNKGDTSLSLSGIGIAGTDARDFTQTNNCGGLLQPGKNCIVKTTFKPGAKSSRTATIAIQAEDGSSPVTVTLSGTGR